MARSTGLRSRIPWRIVVFDPLATASPWLRMLAVVVGLVVIGIQSGLGTSIGSSSWRATFGTSFGITQVIIYATPLLLAGIAVAVGRAVALWNVGVEGQIFLGGWAATGVAFEAPG